MIFEPYIKIAVISDLHCQKEDNSAKVTRLHNQILDNPSNKNPVKALKKKLIEENKKVDYFLVLGDIANKADIAGFLFGMDRIKELNSVFETQKLICTIGNHDMYRDGQIQDPEYTMKSTDDFPFLFKNEDTKDLEATFWSKGFCFIEDEKCVFFVLNSSKYIRAPSSKALEITEGLLSEISSELIQYKTSEKLKIALTHHHPKPQSDFNDKYTSLDCLEFGDRLLDLLNDYKFSIFLHGHKHFPKIKFENKLPVFCSGSFSSLENTSSFNEDNTTHFIDLYKKGGSYIGLIETWIFNERFGWKQSSDIEVRFPAVTGFGLEINIETLIDEIYLTFFKFNEDSPKIYIPVNYEKVVEKFPDLMFLSIEQQKEFDDKLYSKHLISTNYNKQSLNKSFVKNYNR